MCIYHVKKTEEKKKNIRKRWQWNKRNIKRAQCIHKRILQTDTRLYFLLIWTSSSTISFFFLSVLFLWDYFDFRP